MDIKNVLVTGGLGFIASNLLNELVPHYKSVFFVNLDIKDYCADLRNVTISNLPNYHLIEGSINDGHLLDLILEGFEIDTILHFAAKTSVDESFVWPQRYIDNNILGTFTLLESCRKYGKIKKFVHVSTDEIYGETDKDVDEEGKMNPTNPYSATKAGAELLARSYYYSYKLPVIVVRCNNVYGPRQYPEKLIPKFIKLLFENKKCTIHGNGKKYRSYIYVDDVVEAYNLIMTRGKIGEIYNIGNCRRYSVMEVTERLVSLMKPNDSVDKWIEYVPDRNYNDSSYDITHQKITKELGWKPKTSFDIGLKKTVEWYLQTKYLMTN